jgi:hypothetical protein
MTLETLDPFDILVGDKSWQHRELFSLSEQQLLWFIIGKWQQKDIGASEALAMLDNSELLDPDALMMGFAAFHTAVSHKPPLPPSPTPPAAPGARSVPSYEVLEALAKGRAA